MKRFVYILFSILMLGALSSCELDNYEGPDAQIHGKIVDKDGNPVYSDATSSGVKIFYYEQGDFTSPLKQSMGLKPDGTYRNDMLFSGVYDFIITDANFVQIDTVKNFTVAPGDNELNFVVEPYVTIKDLTIEQDEYNVVARFKLNTVGNNTGKVGTIQLFAYLDGIVSYGATFSLTPEPSKVLGKAPNPEKTEVLRIDLTKQGNTFSKYPTETPFCFRVGALIDEGSATAATATSKPAPKWNYSEVVRLKLNLPPTE